MQLKSRFVAALFFAALATLAGCSSTPPAQPIPERITLHVACPPGPAEDVVRAYCKGWEARNNASVQVAVYGAEGPENTGANAWVIAPAELGRWSAAGSLLPIPERLRDKDDDFGWKGLLPLYREHLLLWDRTAYALPLLGAAPLFCYRSDLLKDADRQPPTTWQEVASAAAYFKMKTGAPSLPPLPPDEDGLEQLFYSIAAGYVHRAGANVNALPFHEAFSFQYDLKSGKPRIDGPGFVRALTLLQRLQGYRSAQVEAPVAAFRRGVGVFLLTDAAFIYRLQEEKSPVRDRFAVMRVPAAEVYFAHAARVGDEPVAGANWMPYLGAGGYLSVVPKTAVHAEETFRLLAELGGRAISRQVVLTPRAQPARGGGACRYEQFDRNSRWEAFDLDATRTDELKRTAQQTLEHPNVANPVYRLRTPDERQHRAVLLTALRQALANPAADPATALAAVSRSWQDMDRRNPKHLEEYRLSIGLSPQ